MRYHAITITASVLAGLIGLFSLRSEGTMSSQRANRLPVNSNAAYPYESESSVNGIIHAVAYESQLDRWSPSTQTPTTIYPDMGREPAAESIIDILNIRADQIRRILIDEAEAAGEGKVARFYLQAERDFSELHLHNIQALRKGQPVLAHELTCRIYKLFDEELLRSSLSAKLGVLNSTALISGGVAGHQHSPIQAFYTTVP